MYAIAKKASETGKFGEVTKGMTIISPQKDAHGDLRKYNYDAATQMATDMGILLDGQIVSRNLKFDKLCR